ncbi:MAG TPA: NEW3 domain-containing protein [Candidatus Aminicenantes bacterium]|nr:NEW3 domain-containing protein [Candidatus Aminicenantes bacterium]HOS11737.1 NEW3 domain-containing protein [Candidatus Aminicenantes bacterium]HPL13711.1 NEW3 domain-containing protein [Candidatus Aminicenantes bacterium]HQH45559.1 NEW3 domain-containing protein [Candidatus Aminicenantes bacterium]
MKKIVTLILAAFALNVLAAAQAGQESQTMKLLTLKRAQLTLEKNKGDFDRALKLKEQGLQSEEDFSRTQTAYLQAQVDYQQALISFMGSEARISVASAVKFQDAGGKKFVRVTLRYSSKELKELSRLNISAEDLFPLDFMKEIKDVSVSLKSEDKIVSDPYDKTVASLPLETQQDVTFQLLKDVENLEVDVFYSGKSETTSVYLQKGVSANIVTINSAQFSQEADLESAATFDLSLEKFSGEANIFKLEAVNLPAQLNYEFSDPATSARLSQIKFTEGVTAMKLALKVYLPKNADDQVVIDKPIGFTALALDNDQAARLAELRAKKPVLDEADIAALKAGSVHLELVPRGVGKIEVQAVNLYHEIKVGDTVTMEIRVKNTGTRKLNNIRVSTELPLNWRSTVVPDLIGSLEQGKDEVVTLTFQPPADVAVGDYEPKIKTDCTADNRTVESEDKIVRVHIASKTNVVGIVLLVLLLVGLLVGIVAFGIKLTRR